MVTGILVGVLILVALWASYRVFWWAAVRVSVLLDGVKGGGLAGVGEVAYVVCVAGGAYCSLW